MPLEGENNKSMLGPSVSSLTFNFCKIRYHGSEDHKGTTTKHSALLDIILRSTRNMREKGGKALKKISFPI